MKYAIYRVKDEKGMKTDSLWAWYYTDINDAYHEINYWTMNKLNFRDMSEYEVRECE